MYYVYVQNGQVVEGPRILPIHWNNIANFYLLGKEQLISHGWYPHRFVEVDKSENDLVIGSSFVIGSDEVVEYQLVRPKTEEEIIGELNSLWDAVRSQRNIYLQECDWTQITDSPLSEEKKEEWKIYRQQLRDVTTQLDPYSIVWPNKPE